MSAVSQGISEKIEKALHVEDILEKKKILGEVLTMATEMLERNNITLIDNLEHSISARSVERIDHYARKALDSIFKIKNNRINDLNLARWKDYNEILTDSLWLMEKRDRAKGHDASYWGNFVPQIPRQLMLRYTRKGDWILDPFMGSGTSAIEAYKMERNAIGIDLNPAILSSAKSKIEAIREEDVHNVHICFHNGDSSRIDYDEILKEEGCQEIKLAILHPPYHDIIKFSDIEGDLSICPEQETFLEKIGIVAEKCNKVMSKDGHLALVIGDKYENGRWIPLGFLSMNEIMKKGFYLKSIIVKNYEETRGKRGSQELWRYRALVGGYYLFKHEYIFLFTKK